MDVKRKDLLQENEVLKRENRILRVAFIDFTSQNEQIENKLKCSELRYRRLFESAKDGILILDAETGKIVDVNPFLVELLGYSKEEFIGKAIWEIGCFKDITASMENFLELQQKEYVRYEDLPLETTDKKQISVEFVSNVYLANHQKVIQCNIRDITKRKQAEKELNLYKEQLEERVYKRTAELEQSQATFKALAENTKDVIVRVNKEYKFLYVNHTIEQQSGINTEQFIGKTLFESFFPIELVEILNKSIRKVFESESMQQIEHQLLNGIWIDWRLIPEFDSASKVESVIVSGRDITVTKEIQSTLKQNYAKEHELNDLKNRFISMVSHEFRTPLTSILTSSDLLETGGKLYAEDLKVKHFERIRRSIYNMINMLDDVSFINKIDSSQAHIVLKRTNLPEFCKELFDEIKILFPQITSKIEIDLKNKFYPLDIVLTRNILGNLLSNAFKYSKGKGQVNFTVKKINEKLVFIISDFGIGIPLEEQDSIYDSFSRKSNVKSIKGTGLGMSIIKNSVDILGGVISFTSKENEGTSFKVILPILNKQLE